MSFRSFARTMRTILLNVTFFAVACHLHQVFSRELCLHANDNLMQIFKHMPMIKPRLKLRLPIKEIPDQLCPLPVPVSVFGELFVNSNSLCSWNYSLNSDPDRYPHDILEAKCACNTCLNGIHRCLPIFHELPVVRQICDEGKYVYFWHMEAVAVGCTCSHVRIRQSRRRDTF